MDPEVSRYIFLSLAALTTVIVAEGTYLLVSGKNEKRAAVNRRMRLSEKAVSQKEVLVQLRKERGLDEFDKTSSLSRILKRMHVQSAMKMPLSQFVALTTVISAIIGVAGGQYFNHIQIGLGVGALLMVVMPLFVLNWRRKRRLKIFGNQLPEALDLITRGLKAGHPVPIAVSMVSREMPDPIGSEFGMMSDEVTYGSDMVTALQNLYERVGHEDLPLFVTAVSIQSSTGGNLREILDGLSTVIRERGKLRRKIKAISVEGRMSAYILTAVPVLLAVAMGVLMPDYYGDIMNEPLTWKLIGASLFWLGLGNVALFKMASFKF